MFCRFSFFFILLLGIGSFSVRAQTSEWPVVFYQVQVKNQSLKADELAGHLVRELGGIRLELPATVSQRMKDKKEEFVGLTLWDEAKRSSARGQLLAVAMVEEVSPRFLLSLQLFKIGEFKDQLFKDLDTTEYPLKNYLPTFKVRFTLDSIAEQMRNEVADRLTKTLKADFNPDPIRHRFLFKEDKPPKTK